MARTLLFLGYDHEHDEKLHRLFIDQSNKADSPFEVVHVSFKDAVDQIWKANTRAHIRETKVVAIICGKHTATAKGVCAEVLIAQEEQIPYFFIQGHRQTGCQKPTTARSCDKLHEWTWKNLKLLVKTNSS